MMIQSIVHTTKHDWWWIRKLVRDILSVYALCFAMDPGGAWGSLGALRESWGALGALGPQDPQDPQAPDLAQPPLVAPTRLVNVHPQSPRLGFWFSKIYNL